MEIQEEETKLVVIFTKKERDDFQNACNERYGRISMSAAIRLIAKAVSESEGIIQALVSSMLRLKNQSETIE